MDWSGIGEFMQNFRTANILWHIQTLDVDELIHNPWFLAALGGFAVIALIMRWRVLLATMLTVTGFTGLIAYTMQQETELGSLSSDTLLMFVGVGSAIIFVVIYLLFIKAE